MCIRDSNRLTDGVTFVYAVFSVELLVLLCLVARIILEQESVRNNAALCFAIFLSPATFVHFAYAQGNLDVPICILLLLALFCASNPWILAMLVVAGVLTHESFIFFLPAIFLLKLLALSDRKQNITPLVVPATAATIASLIVVLGGRLEHVSQFAYEGLMARRMPQFAGLIHLWSGILSRFEVALLVGFCRPQRCLIHPLV